MEGTGHGAQSGVKEENPKQPGSVTLQTRGREDLLLGYAQRCALCLAVTRHHNESTRAAVTRCFTRK